MILVDTNLLVCAHISSAREHARAKAWLDERLSDSTRVGLPWQSILGYLRVATNRRIFPNAPSLETAWAQTQSWLACPNVWIPTPGPDAPEILGRMLVHARAGANLIPDAALAALAVEHGLTLCSNDGDFARFTGLKWMNPLA